MGTRTNSVLIIGGGFSGMTAAIQLSRAGFDVELVELDPKWCPLGAGITLSGPTLRALDTLDLLEEVSEKGFLSQDFDVFDPNGELLLSLPLQPPKSDKEVPSGGGILRPVLAGIMSGAVKGTKTKVRLGITFESIEDQGDSVEVRFSDGTHGNYDLVIGADGLHSKVRKECFPEAPCPQPLSQSVWRALLRRPPEISRPSHWIGRFKVGVNPISETHMYMFLMETRGVDDKIDPANWPEEMANLLAEFPAPILQSLVDDLYKPEAQIDYRPLSNLLVPLPWHRGRVVMIGDAAHATTPHLASGAGIGIESAIVLSEELARGDDLETTLDRFEKRRWERCRLVVENSARLCEIEKQGGSKKEHSEIMRKSFIELSERI